jgi:hypothetical protein
MDDGVTPGGAVGRWVFHCHIFFHAVFGMISEFVVLPSSKPILSLPGDQTQDYHDFLTFNISATDPNNDPITLSSTALPAGLTLVDHGDGTATISGTLTATPGAYPVTFSASDGNNPPVNGTLTITVTKEETGLVYTGPTVILNGGNLTMSAVLKEETDSSGPGIAGRTVNMTLGAQGCSGARTPQASRSASSSSTAPLEPRRRSPRTSRATRSTGHRRRPRQRSCLHSRLEEPSRSAIPVRPRLGRRHSGRPSGRT